MNNNNILIDTVYEATDGDYAVIVFPASQVPEDVLEKMDKIERIHLPESHIERVYLSDPHKDVNIEEFGEVSQNYPKNIDTDELYRISQNYTASMIEMINMKADIEKEMVYCTAAYGFAQAKTMCRIIEDKGI